MNKTIMSIIAIIVIIGAIIEMILPEGNYNWSSNL